MAASEPGVAPSESASASDFTPAELSTFARFASYPFDKDHVFLQGQEGVKKRAEEKWEADNKVEDGEEGEDKIDMADREKRKKEWVETEMVGAKIFYFELTLLYSLALSSRTFSTKLSVPRLNTYLSLRSTNSLPTPSSAPSTSTPTHVFESFLRYDFTHDPGFEEGVKKILEGHPEGKERDEAVERAKGWYYNRFIQPMDYSEFTAWKARQDRGETDEHEQPEQTPVEAAAATLESTGTAQPAEEPTKDPTPAAESTGEPKYPASFMELCQMLAEGKPIPGIREIPNKINEGTPSEAKEVPRKKPWEK